MNAEPHLDSRPAAANACAMCKPTRFFGVVLALLTPSLISAPAGAAAPAPQLDLEQLEWGCVAQCRAWSDAEQTLFCLDGGESLSCNDCSAAFVSAKDGKLHWQLVQACGQMEADIDKARVATINRRLKRGRYQPVEPLWASGPVSTAQTALQGDLGDGVRATRRGDELLVMRGDTVLDRTRWRFDPELDPEHEVTNVAIYRLGPARLLVVFDYHNPDFVTHDRRQVVLKRTVTSSRPAARPERQVTCPPTAECSPAYGKVVAYLEAVCAGQLTDDDLAALEVMAAGAIIGAPELVLLFNAHGAFHGYRFKRETWLNSLFYGQGREQWLPAACVKRFSSFARASEVPKADTKARNALKAIWNRHK